MAAAIPTLSSFETDVSTMQPQELDASAFPLSETQSRSPKTTSAQKPSARSSTQMSVRLDATLKAKGDAVLAEAGYTPSSAVRALWSFAASHAENPQNVSSLLNSARTQADENFQAHKNETLERIYQGHAIVNNARARLGISESTALVDYDDVLYEAMMDRARERGLT